VACRAQPAFTVHGLVLSPRYASRAPPRPRCGLEHDVHAAALSAWTCWHLVNTAWTVSTCPPALIPLSAGACLPVSLPTSLMFESEHRHQRFVDSGYSAAASSERIFLPFCCDVPQGVGTLRAPSPPTHGAPPLTISRATIVTHARVIDSAADGALLREEIQDAGATTRA